MIGRDVLTFNLSIKKFKLTYSSFLLPLFPPVSLPTHLACFLTMYRYTHVAIPICSSLLKMFYLCRNNGKPSIKEIMLIFWQIKQVHRKIEEVCILYSNNRTISIKQFISIFKWMNLSVRKSWKLLLHRWWAKKWQNLVLKFTQAIDLRGRNLTK